MKKSYLILSHCALFGAAFAFGVAGRVSDAAGEPSLATKSSSKKQLSHTDEELVLAELLSQAPETGPEPRWKALMAELPPGSVGQAEVAQAFEKLPEKYLNLSLTGNESSPLFYGELKFSAEEFAHIAFFEASVARWMEVDGVSCLAFLEEGFPQDRCLYYRSITHSVLRVLAVEKLLGNEGVPWLNNSGRFFCSRIASDLKKAGVSLLSERELGDGVVADPANLVPGLGLRLTFDERETLLESIFSERNKMRGYYPVHTIAEFLKQENHPPEEMLAWMTDVERRGIIPSDEQAQVKAYFSDWIRARKDLPADERVDALTQMGTARGDQFRFLAEDDVVNYLEEARDWRYEFRHGRVTAREVWEEMKSAMPGILDNERSLVGARHIVLRELAEENAGRAIELVSDLPESEQRDALFHATWTAFENVHPQRLLEFSQALPEPEAKWEFETKLKGWDFQIRPQMNRLGEDYIEWTRQMPAGVERDKVVDSIIWWVGNEDRARGNALREELKN